MSIDALSILDSREKREDGFAYKLAGGKFGLDAVSNKELDIDEKEMSIWIPFADGNNIDGVGDVLEVGGIDLSRHRVNPFVLFDHGKRVDLPIGSAEDPQTKQYMVEINSVAKTARGKCFMYQSLKKSDHLLFCEQLFDLAVKRLVRAGSIGYQVKSAMPIPANYITGTPQGLHLIKVLMLEFSLVVLPANADTTLKILSMPKICGKNKSPYLVKSLEDYAPPRKAQLGWEGKSAAKSFADQLNEKAGRFVAGTELHDPLRSGDQEYSVHRVYDTETGQLRGDSPYTRAETERRVQGLNTMYEREGYVPKENYPISNVEDPNLPVNLESRDDRHRLLHDEYLYEEDKTLTREDAKSLADQLNKAHANPSYHTPYGIRPVDPVRKGEDDPHDVTLDTAMGPIPVEQHPTASSSKERSDEYNEEVRSAELEMEGYPEDLEEAWGNTLTKEEAKALAIQLNKELVPIPVVRKTKIPPAKWKPGVGAMKSTYSSNEQVARVDSTTFPGNVEEPHRVVVRGYLPEAGSPVWGVLPTDNLDEAKRTADWLNANPGMSNEEFGRGVPQPPERTYGTEGEAKSLDLQEAKDLAEAMNKAFVKSQEDTTEHIRNIRLEPSSESNSPTYVDIAPPVGHYHTGIHLRTEADEDQTDVIEGRRQADPSETYHYVRLPSGAEVPFRASEGRIKFPQKAVHQPTLNRAIERSNQYRDRPVLSHNEAEEAGVSNYYPANMLVRPGQHISNTSANAGGAQHITEEAGLSEEDERDTLEAFRNRTEKFGDKTLKSLRKKYKTQDPSWKLKNASPSTVLICVQQKDLETAQEVALEKGVKFQQLGLRENLEKVKLTGSEKSVEEIARAFGKAVNWGKRGRKSKESKQAEGDWNQPMELGDYGPLDEDFFGNDPTFADPRTKPKLTEENKALDEHGKPEHSSIEEYPTPLAEDVDWKPIEEDAEKYSASLPVVQPGTKRD